MAGILHKREVWRDDWEAALHALRRPQTELAVKGCALLVSLMKASCESLDSDQMGPDDFDDEDVFCDLCVLLRCGLDGMTVYNADASDGKFKQKWHHQSRLKFMDDNSVGLSEGTDLEPYAPRSATGGILAARRAVSLALKTLAHLYHYYNWHGDDMLDEAGEDANWVLTLTCLTCGDTTAAETWAEDAASVRRSCRSGCGGFLRCACKATLALALTLALTLALCKATATAAASSAHTSSTACCPRSRAAASELQHTCCAAPRSPAPARTFRWWACCCITSPNPNPNPNQVRARRRGRERAAAPQHHQADHLRPAAAREAAARAVRG